MTPTDTYHRRLERGRRFWDRSARIERANKLPAGWLQAQWRLAVDQLGLQHGQVVLDFGCGTGPALPFLREAVGETGRVVGVDYSPRRLAVASEVIAAYGWDNVEVRRADVSAEKLEPQAYDAAVASYVLGAVPDIDKAVALLYDALRPGGRVFACDMAFGPQPGARLLRGFYRRVMTGNGEDIQAALARRFDHVGPADDHKGRKLARDTGRSWPPWTYLLAHRAV